MPTILLLCGKVNFTNLSRYSELSEKTYRRHYSQPFDFVGVNTQLIEVAIPASAQRIGAMDCSFIPKSGKQTYGLDWFYNGSASRTEKGLEISVIAIVDVAAHQGYTLSVQQTPAHLGKVRAKAPVPQPPGITRAVIEAARVMLQTLPPTPVAAAAELTRIDYYLQQLQATPWPADVTYLAVDGYYSKLKFVDGVVARKLHMIGKLRHDADLRYLYTGPQKARGAKRKYDGKVDLHDRTRFTHVSQLEPQVNLYTAVVWHVSLKRKIRLACLVDTRKPGKTGFALLFSTDVELAADLILTYYKARYQIEFIFRDAKQFTGLCDAQTRDPKKLDFHFNASLTALNLAKVEARAQHPHTQPQPFSMASYKRLALNDHLLSRFIAMLDLDSTLIKSHPNYQNLRSYGLIAA